MKEGEPEKYVWLHNLRERGGEKGAFITGQLARRREECLADHPVKSKNRWLNQEKHGRTNRLFEKGDVSRTRPWRPGGCIRWKRVAVATQEDKSTVDQAQTKRKTIDAVQ